MDRTSPGAQARGARGGQEVGKVAATLRVGGSVIRPGKEGCCRKGYSALLPVLPPFQVDSCAMDSGIPVQLHLRLPLHKGFSQLSLLS